MNNCLYHATNVEIAFGMRCSRWKVQLDVLNFVTIEVDDQVDQSVCPIFGMPLISCHAVAPANFMPERKRSSALSEAFSVDCPFPVISKNIFARPPRSAVAWPCLLFTKPFFS